MGLIDREFPPMRKSMNAIIAEPTSTGALPACSYCGGRFVAPGQPRNGLTIPLSPRERQMVLLIQQAKSNKEIAYELGLTVGTVKEYLHRLFRKLSVANRTELAVRSTLVGPAHAVTLAADS